MPLRPHRGYAVDLHHDLLGPAHNAAVIRLVGAVLADMHDEWQAGDRRYLSATSMAQLHPERDTDTVAALDGER